MAPKLIKVNKEANNFELIEELELVRTANGSSMSWVESFIKDLSKAPVAKQTAVGGLSGWVVGYVSMKIGKLAATVVGGSMIIMQLAVYQGYIKVNWSKVNKDLNKKAQKLSEDMQTKMGTDMLKNKSAGTYIDRKISENVKKIKNLENETESWLNKKMKWGQRSYRKYILGERELTIEDLYAINVYVIAFSVGTMLGVTCGKVL